MAIIEQFEALLAKGQDNALLRYGLGSAYLKQASYPQAVIHLAQAVALDPHYSAAWKGYGKALAADGQTAAAQAAYRRGIEVATEQGDLQAAKEMQVFLKRLEK